MVSFLGRMGGAINSTFNAVGKAAKDATIQVGRGIWVGGERGSRWSHEVYSMSGFEKFSKTLIADLKFIALFPGCKDVFKESIKTLEAQKELIYATLVFESTPNFIAEHIDEDTREKTYHFQLPRDRKGNYDFQTILYGIANLLDTLYFLKKYKVCSFPAISVVGARLGACQLFSYKGEDWKFNHIPVLNSITNRPKDLFVFIASVMAAHKYVQAPRLDPENLCKFIGNIGKIVLISTADLMVKSQRFALLAVVDLVTQNSGVIAYLIKRGKDRDDRFHNPVNI